MSGFPVGDCSVGPTYTPKRKMLHCFKQQLQNLVFSLAVFSVLFSSHGSTVEERRDGHENHDANGDTNATKHGGSNARSKSIHGVILRKLGKLNYYCRSKSIHGVLTPSCTSCSTWRQPMTIWDRVFLWHFRRKPIFPTFPQDLGPFRPPPTKTHPEKNLENSFTCREVIVNTNLFLLLVDVCHPQRYGTSIFFIVTQMWRIMEVRRFDDLFLNQPSFNDIEV